MSDFLVFHTNAVSNFAYFLIANIWLILLAIGCGGMILLRLKESIDSSVREEQNII